MERHVGSHTPSIITRASLRLAFLLLAPQGWSQWLTIASPNNFNIWLQSLFASQFTRSAPILCFKRNLFYTSLPGSASLRLCLSLLPSLRAFLCLQEGIPVELIKILGDWYSDANFSFILRFHLLSDFNQLISSSRLLFHTTPFNSTLRLECKDRKSVV